MPQLKVYCYSCLQWHSFTTEKYFRCMYRSCPMPYKFDVFDEETTAIGHYDVVDSWMPKFCFQPLHMDTGKKHPSLWCVAYNDERVSAFAVDNFSDLLRQETLLLLESGFGAETGEPVSVVEPSGIRYEKIEPIPGAGERVSIPKNCTRYCRLIRNSSNHGVSGNELCWECDHSMVMALKHNNPLPNLLEEAVLECGGDDVRVYAYRCWAGLVDCLSPIYVQGNLVAVVFSGQRQLVDEQFQMELHSLIDALVSQKTGLSASELKEASEDAATDEEFRGRQLAIRRDELVDSCLIPLSRIAHEVTVLAEERYTAKRKEREEYFIREMSHLLETEPNTVGGVTDLHRVLKRLAEFMSLDETIFFLNNPESPLLYQMHAKASGSSINESEVGLEIDVDAERLRIDDRITLFNPAEKLDAKSLLDQLVASGAVKLGQEVLVGSCPLLGVNKGFWLFINPNTQVALRSDPSFNALDIRFLTKFCSELHSILSKQLASAFVLRSIGHQLGAATQNILNAQERIIELSEPGSRNSLSSDMKEISKCAQRNLIRIKEYHHLIENLKNLFLRKTSEAYVYENYSIAKPVDEVQTLIACDTLCGQHSIDLRSPIFRKRSTVSMNRPSLTLAIYNLIQNAVKYTFNNHYIEIECAEEEINEELFCRLTISNFGVGITKEEIQRRLIFRQDYRGILSGDRNRQGTGLGLTIVGQIIAAHGGWIEVESTPASDILRQGSTGEKRFLPQNDVRFIVDRNKDQICGFLNVFKIYLPVAKEKNE